MRQLKKSSRKETKTDIVHLLDKDHKTVEKLFKQIERASSAKKAELYLKLREELTNHAQAEEKAIYQSLLTKKEEMKDMAREGFEEHDVMKHLFAKLDRLGVESERFDPTLKVLKEVVEHHVEEEEEDMFTKLRSQFSATEKERMVAIFQSAKLGVVERIKRMVA